MKTAMEQSRQDSLIALAKSVAYVEGDAAECGVWQGGNLINIAKALPHKMVFGFDTFTGIPQSGWASDDQYVPGQFANTSVAEVQANVAPYANIQLVPGLFPESVMALDHRFAFVHLDFDVYYSTKSALAWLLPRMTKGGLIVFDDYDNPKAPGIRRAIEEMGLTVTVPHRLQAAARIM